MRKLSYRDYCAGERNRKNSFLAGFLIVCIVLAITAISVYLVYQHNGQNARTREELSRSLDCLYTSGEVRIYVSEKKVWTVRRGIFQIQPGDRILTENTQLVVLAFDKNNSVRIGPQSEFVYKGFANKQYTVTLRMGKIFLDTYYGRYRVETPSGYAIAEKTKAVAEYLPDGDFNLYCISGSLQADAINEEAPERRLLEGEKISINRKLQISKQEIFDLENLGTWEKLNLTFSGNDVRLGHVPIKNEDDTLDERVSLRFKPRPLPIEYLPKKKKDSSPKKKKSTKKKLVTIPSLGKRKYPLARPRFTRVIKPTPLVYTEKNYPMAPVSAAQKPENASTRKKISAYEREYYKYLEEQEKKIKWNLGGYYYLSNKRRNDKNPASVPGYGLNSQPVGPSEITIGEYNQGKRPTDIWDEIYYRSFLSR